MYVKANTSNQKRVIGVSHMKLTRIVAPSTVGRQMHVSKLAALENLARRSYGTSWEINVATPIGVLPVSSQLARFGPKRAVGNLGTSSPGVMFAQILSLIIRLRAPLAPA
jgi:hypothetical protein